jgi:hypothetical protein
MLFVLNLKLNPSIHAGRRGRDVISSNFGTRIHYLASTSEGLDRDLCPERYIFEVKIPEILLFPGKYKIELRIKREGEKYDDRIDDVVYFDVIKGDTSGLPKMGKYDFVGSKVYTSKYGG